MTNILVVDDEPRLRMVLTRLLEAANFRVTCAATGAEAVRHAMAEDFDLIVLDLGLPDLSGAEVLRVIMATKPESRVLVLSSITEVGARVQVLEGGASDFLLKPFLSAELLARIRLRLRGETATSGRSSKRLAVADDLYLDFDRRELIAGQARVSLSQREFALLAHLVGRRGETCSREELLADVWGLGFDPGTNVVDVCVRRLRNKLAGDTIETVRNVGYRLAAC